MPRGDKNRKNEAARRGEPRGRGGMGPGRGRGRGRSRGRGNRIGSRGPFFASPDEIYRMDGSLVFEGDFQDFTLDDFTQSKARTLKSQKRATTAESKYLRSPNVFPRSSQSGGRSARQRFMPGIGYPTGQSGPKVPISVLERERPLLQPIKFIKGEHVKTLFEEVEEILHVPGEGAETCETNAQNDIIEQIFQNHFSMGDSSDPGGESKDEARIEAKSENNIENNLEKETNIIGSIDTTEGISNAIKEDLRALPSHSTHGSKHSESHINSSILEVDTAAREQSDPFVVDTSPNAVVFESGDISFNRVTGMAPLGQLPLEDEVIVYEAPNPRTSRAATPNAVPTFDSISLSFGGKRDPEEALFVSVRTHKLLGLKLTPRSRKMAKKEQAGHKKRRGRRLSMLSIGLNCEHRTALKERSIAKESSRKAERRMGDSDIDWGSEDEDKGAIDNSGHNIEDIELDPDLDIDVAVLNRFANGVNGFAGNTFLTMDDLADIQRMKEEDEDTDSSGLTDESNEAFKVLEHQGVDDFEVLDSSESEEDSDEDTPRTSFQNRLQRLRKQRMAKTPADDDASSEDEGHWGVFGKGPSRANRDEEFGGRINEIIDENDFILRGDRKSRKKMFKAIEQGSFEDILDTSLNGSSKKSQHIPVELRAQWERDRQKKAQRRRERELARLQEAINASPSGRGKLHKKKRKLLAQARLTFDGETLHTGNVDTLEMLESLLRKFLTSLELRTMVIPPRDKEFRRRAHLLAEAFHIKSKSQGKDEKRFTTFTKTSRSGIDINEHKISSIIRGETHRSSGKASGARVHIRHKDGEVVGKAAPRLNDSNIGFKILQQMGWTEGQRIGVTGGLSDPLTAVIKTTKLGLGATR